LHAGHQKWVSGIKISASLKTNFVIRSDADVGVFDASDVYTGGNTYDLIPFIAEIYNLGKPEYYVVAVGRENDPSTELTFLRGTLKNYKLGK
jgi:hypothetical protein